MKSSYFKLDNGVTVTVIRDGIRKYAVAQNIDTGEIIYTGPTYNSTPSNPISDKKIGYEAIDYLNIYYNTSLNLKWGKLVLNSKSPSSPLLVVYGGIPVGGKKSDQYMPDYIYKNEIINKYSTWIAKSSDVNQGTAVPSNISYKELTDALSNNNIIPSKRILYLFSGGWRAGKDIIENSSYTQDFDYFYLVDIWIGNSSSLNTYLNLAKSNKGKVYYFNTKSGASSEINRKALIEAVGIENSKECSGHMASNISAVNHIIQNQ